MAIKYNNNIYKKKKNMKLKTIQYDLGFYSSVAKSGSHAISKQAEEQTRNLYEPKVQHLMFVHLCLHIGITLALYKLFFGGHDYDNQQNDAQAMLG